MSTINESKINQLLQRQPPETVFLSNWLVKQGFSRELQKRYKKSGWFESIGPGAMIRKNDSVTWLGALYSIQKYSQLKIHLGGKIALGIQGKSHFLELHPHKIDLFAPLQTVLPNWFKKYDWGVLPVLHNTNFLPLELGITEISPLALNLSTTQNEKKQLQIKISGTIRALMECLYLAPKHFDLLECYQMMENLTTLRPLQVQKLLEACNSIKVVRLFLFMAEKAQHAWVKYLNLNKINLGKGKRSLIPNGVYLPKYQITVPRELTE